MGDVLSILSAIATNVNVIGIATIASMIIAIISFIISIYFYLLNKKDWIKLYQELIKARESLETRLLDLVKEGQISKEDKEKLELEIKNEVFNPLEAWIRRKRKAERRL